MSTNKQETNRQTDLVLEVAPPEVGHLKRLELVLLLIYNWIYGQNLYMIKATDICKEIKLDPPEQVILKANMKHIVKRV